MLGLVKNATVWIIPVSSLFVFPVWALAETGINAGHTPGYVPGELLVKFRPSVRASASEDYQIRMGVSTLQTFEAIGAQHVRLPEGMTVQEALEIYTDDPGVEYAEPNYLRRICLTPNDPDFGELWGLHNAGQSVNGTSGTSDADMDAPEAWEGPKTGDGGVVVAVLDTGADLDHEDLFDNIVAGWDFVNDDNDPDDDNNPTYHGTHVCGTIGAKGNNATGITGVNWSVSIMPIKILNASGNGTVADEIDAINYAIANGANIINASFSGTNYSDAERGAIESARVAGILFIAAAGNGGGDNTGPGWDNDEAGQEIYPASYDLANIIAVAATDQDDLRADFSNYGPTSVDVAAPGENIYSTKPGDAYQYLNGTSMATPHVSGLAALIWAENIAGYDYADVKPRVLNGVDVKPALTATVLMAGRINANNSMNPGSLPDAPSSLVVAALSTSEISLSWTDNADDESGFKIERKTVLGGTYSHIATVATNVESYGDAGLTEGTTYYYQIRAFNSAGDSSASNEDNAATYAAAPSGLSASAVSSSRIDLAWTDNSSGETGFKVERKTGLGGTYTEIDVVAADTITYRSTGLNASTAYYYRVRAYNGSGNSSYSNETNSTTLAAPEVNSGDGGGGPCFISSLTRKRLKLLLRRQTKGSEGATGNH